MFTLKMFEERLEAALKFIKSVPVPEKLQAGLRDKQVSSINHLIVVMLLVGLLNTAIVLLELRLDGATPMSAFWGFGLVLLNGLTFLQHLRGRKYSQSPGYAARKIDAVAKGATLHGLFWGALPLMVGIGAADPQFMAITTITAGMMFGGTFLLSRVPVAAVCFVVPIGLGLVGAALLRGGLSSHLIGVLSAVYVFVLIYSVRWAHRQFVQQYLSEAALAEQSQVISLLLRDFGESSSDWLWQTGADFRLEAVPGNGGDEKSKSFMSAGRNFFSLFQAGESRRRLEDMMRAREAFHDVVLRVRVSGCDNCWVSLTGKPIHEDDRFVGFRGVASNVTQAKQAEDRIERMAHYDELTGLPNRANLLSQLDGWASAPLEIASERALLCLDLDTFKVINDTMGHQAADQLLRQVTNRLTEHALGCDIVARIASDGFVLAVERPLDGGLEVFLDELSAYLNEPYSVWDASIVCTASIGVRRMDDRNLDAPSALKHADLAMHAARRKGKGQWALFTAEMTDRAEARLRGESELRKAIELGQLHLVYQPQMSAQTHKLVGFEALVRWNHPKLGMIPPSEFVPIAEENGLIVPIGEWIIRSAMAQAARLPDNIKVAINISPLQMNSTNLVSTIVHALAANRLDPSRIELEITESVLMADTGFALDRLRQLRDMGLRISLDDFGTGYSSLSYLRMFPFHKIKIDQSFVREVETDNESRAITQATLSLAKLMGLRCTAEGVETLFQASFLREHGCDELQGYLVGKPQPMEKMWHLIEAAGGLPAAPEAEAGAAPAPMPRNALAS
jgi:diguanylate cyclase (GGDEF)-like protein